MLVQATERFRWIGCFLNLFLALLMVVGLVLGLRDPISIWVCVLLLLGVIVCGINAWMMAFLPRERA